MKFCKICQSEKNIEIKKMMDFEFYKCQICGYVWEKNERHTR